VPAEPVRYEMLAQAILARARALPAPGPIELRFHLIPEGLGPVTVRMGSRGRKIRVEIAASTAGARDLLAAEAGRLGEALERHGFRDPQVRVGLDLGSGRGGGGGAEAGPDAFERPAQGGRPLGGTAPPSGPAGRAGEKENSGLDIRI